MCDPCSPASTDAVFLALDLDGPEYFTVDADIMKGFKELNYLSVSYRISSPWESTQSYQRVEHRIDTADALPIYSHL